MKDINILYGLYDDDDTLKTAIVKMRAEGIKISEVFTPFPVHGLDKALGLRKTRLSDIGYGYAVFGTTLASLLTWFVMNYDWPQNIGGKPSFSWGENMPAFVPVMFEMTVFCAAHLMSLTFLFRSGLAPWKNPQNPDPRTTDDKFMVQIEVNAQDVDKTKDALIATGAQEVTLQNRVER